MNWWNKNKKITLLIFAGSLLVIGAVAILLMFLGPVVGCTSVGCRAGITIELSDLPAGTPYHVILSFSSGETRTISCNLGAEDNPNSFEKSCSSTGAYFSLVPDSLPPDEVTVMVVVGENRVSQVFHPAYEKIQPNGANCAPTCYGAMLKVYIPVRTYV